MPQRLHRMNLSRATRRQQSRQQGDKADREHGGDTGGNVKRRDFNEEALHRPPRRPSAKNSQGNPQQEEFCAEREELPTDHSRRGSAGHANRHFTTTLRNRVGQHAVNTDAGQQQRHASERRRQNGGLSASEQAVVDARLHWLEVDQRQPRIELAHDLFQRRSHHSGGGRRAGDDLKVGKLGVR